MPSGGEVPKQYNEFEVANCVTKACAWSDNSADFVFADGTVLSFCDSMATFVAVTSRGDASYNGMTSIMTSCTNPGDEKMHPGVRDSCGESSPMVASTRDMMLTHLALSKYEEKVRSALAVYNQFSENPRVIVGMTKQRKAATEPSLRIDDEQSQGLRYLEDAVATSGVELRTTAQADAESGAMEKKSDPSGCESQIHGERMERASRYELMNATRAALIARRENIDQVNGGLHVWRENSPIDALILCKTRDLFEVLDRDGTCRLWCALRRISLTLHGNGETFEVCWPARATERDGTNYFFATPMNEYDELVSSVATQRVCHYVWLEQTYPILRVPDTWKVMLQMAVELRAESGLDAEQSGEASSQWTSQAATSQWEDGAHFCGTTPLSAEPNLCSNLPKLGSARHQAVHFSKIQPGDAHALVSSSQMQSLSINQRLRPQSVSLTWRYDGDPLGKVPNAMYWNVSGCPSKSDGENEHRNTAPPPGCVLALVLEDHTTVAAAPQGRDYVVQHFLRRGIARSYHQPMDGNINLPAVVVTDVQTTYPDSSSSSYHRMTSQGNQVSVTDDAGTREPRYGKGRYLPFVGTSLIQISRCVLSSKLRDVSSNTFGQSSARTFYHSQETAHTSSYPDAHPIPKAESPHPPGTPNEESNTNDVQQPSSVLYASEPKRRVSDYRRIEKKVDEFDRTIIEKYMNEPLRIVPSHVQEGVVLLTSRIDGVGSFTAMTNGVCRGHFDDRTIVTLYPYFPSHLAKDDDSQFAMDHSLGASFIPIGGGGGGCDSGFDADEENLVAHAIFRDATQNTLRAQRCLPHNPMYRYLAYLIPFRRFTRLSPRDRAALPSAIDDQTMALSDGLHARYTEVEMESEKRRRRIDELLRRNYELSTRNRTVLGHPLHVSRSQPNVGIDGAKAAVNLDAELDGAAVGSEGWRWEAHRPGLRSTHDSTNSQHPSTSAYFLDVKTN